MTRREFTFAAAGAAVSAAATPKPLVCIFSKHLAKFSFEELGRVAHDTGFAGVDLTVRPGGHVLPERVAEDLPRAVGAIQTRGPAVPLITTAITSGSEESTRAVLSTASGLKIPFYKPGYWMFGNGNPEADVARARREMEPLVALGKRLGIRAGYHNHSGPYVGYDVRDTRELLNGVDPAWAGYYFDAAHATIEGGLAGWEIAMRIALPRIKLAAMKDFYWEKRGGRWNVHWCPLGQGMVDWPKVLGAYAAARFAGPMSIHVEYEPADPVAAGARDLEFLRKQISAAYGD